MESGSNTTVMTFALGAMTRFNTALICALLLVYAQAAATLAKQLEQNEHPLERLLEPKSIIPKDRYPLLNDALPFEMQGKGRFDSINRALEPKDELEIQLQLEKHLYSQFKRNIGNQFSKSRQISCELKYELKKDKTIQNVRLVRPSTDPTFNEAARLAVQDFGVSFVCAAYELRGNTLHLQSIFTPDGIYPGFTGKVFMRNVSSPNPILDKPCE